MKNAIVTIVKDKDGNIIKPGDTITDFRGDQTTFHSVSRPPQEGRTAKVLVGTDDGLREYYCTVFGLTVTVS